MLNRLERGVHKNFLYLLLVAALIHGLLYVFLVPPWQHYDEPGHFEYVWLVANRAQWPQEGDFDPQMRREVAASMVAHNFYRGMQNVPDLSLNRTEPIYIGISQIQKETLYYFLASIPLRVFRPADITTQLEIVRLVSMFFFVLTIFIIYRACGEIFPSGHPLRWMIPLFVCLLPPFVDLMTAVNNDVIATASGTFLVWLCIVLIQKGISLPRLIWLGMACTLCIASKETSAIIAIPLGGIALILGAFRANRKLAWGITVAAVIFAFGLAFSWDSAIPAYFYSFGETYLPLRQESSQAPVGKYVLAQKPQELSSNSFYFMIPPDDFSRLRGKVVTLGFWAWASQPVDISVPMLQVYRGNLIYNGSLHLETEPLFFKFPSTLPEEANLGWFWFFPTEKAGTTLYWNGLVLAEGNFGEAYPPKFSDNRALEGTWGGVHFTNLVQNPSAQSTWPILRPALGKIIQNIGLTSSYLWSWLDWRDMGWYYRSTAAQIFRSFWGKFGWSHVTLEGRKPFWVFLFVSVISLAGNMTYLFRNRKCINWTMAFVGLFSLGLEIGIVLLRGAGSWLNYIFIPGARYAYPVIFPIGVFLCSGWYGILNLFKISPKARSGLAISYIGILILYNYWSLHSIISFYASGG